MRSAGGLFEKIVSAGNLYCALLRASQGKRGRDTVIRFLANAASEIPLLQKELMEGSYLPLPYRQFKILDPKPRLISCADFRDRVVHHAVCSVIAPVIERRLISDNYACRRGKGSHRAILRAQRFSRRFGYFLKTDIRHYYATIDHAILLGMLKRLFREEMLHRLFSVIVRHPVPGQAEGKGLPIGNLTSQWFANLYMDETDHWIKEGYGIGGYVRYMDDLGMWSDSKERLFALADDLGRFLAVRLGIELKHDRTTVAPCSEGMPFLGWRIYPNMLRRDGRRLRRQRRLFRIREEQFMRGEITAEMLRDCVRSINGARSFFAFGEPMESLKEL